MRRGHRCCRCCDDVGAALLLLSKELVVVLVVLVLLLVRLVLLVFLVLSILLISVGHLRCVCMERLLWMCRLCMDLPVVAMRLHHVHVAIFVLHLLLDPCHLHEHILLFIICDCLAEVAWHCLSMRLL